MMRRRRRRRGVSGGIEIAPPTYSKLYKYIAEAVGLAWRYDWLEGLVFSVLVVT